MKNIYLFISVMFLSIYSCVFPTYVYEDVELSDMIYVDGVKKDDLFVLANSWFVKHFYSREAVIQYEDKDAGVIVGRYILIDRAESPDTYALINMRMGDGKISIRLQGILKSLDNSEETIKWKEKERIRLGEQDGPVDEKGHAIERWDDLVQSLAIFLEKEILIMENF